MKSYHQYTNAAIVTLLGDLLCELAQVAILQQVMHRMGDEGYGVCCFKLHLQ